MQIFHSVVELQAALKAYRNDLKTSTIGFVPTMGALHEGHLSLIEKAKAKTDLIICSIFVNPTQFNNQNDLKKYPRDLQSDKKMLLQAKCDILFAPSVEEMYPTGQETPYIIDFSGKDEVMEGEFRPGHFKGVAMVVERFFRIIQPDYAFFGRKDFQQIAIIKEMVLSRNLTVEIIEVATLRSEKGLALSSRNALLTDQQLNEALIIYQTLSFLKANYSKLPFQELRNSALKVFEAGHLKLEYLEIIDNETLRFPNESSEKITACIAAYCGEVRLIDNLQLN